MRDYKRGKIGERLICGGDYYMSIYGIFEKSRRKMNMFPSINMIPSFNDVTSYRCVGLHIYNVYMLVNSTNHLWINVQILQNIKASVWAHIYSIKNTFQFNCILPFTAAAWWNLILWMSCITVSAYQAYLWVSVSIHTIYNP